MTDGPKPPPPGTALAGWARGLPAARVVPSVESLLGDVYLLAKSEIDNMKRRALTNGTGMTPQDVRTLEGITRTLRLAYDLDREVEEHEAKLLPKDTAELAEIAAGVRPWAPPDEGDP